MEEISAQFNAAIERNDVSGARSLATMFDTTPAKQHLRLAAYRQVMLLALELGNGMAAQEVAPFAGHRISRQQYKNCMHQAVNHGDLKNVIWCSHYCGVRPTPDQLAKLTPEFPAVYSSLLGIIRRHLSESDLSEEETLLLWIAEANYPG